MAKPSLVGQAAVPGFVALAGHPLRWSLLAQLARSDRHVNELTHLLDQPQALVSYHLGRLRAGGLVSSRRSSYDGRASYYRVDLQRCGEALSATGVALHPGLALQPVPATMRPAPRSGRVRVLFACTGNGARSQIAEALLQHIAGGRVEVCSGGSHPKPIHPNAVQVLAERGIDISDRHSKPLSQFEGRYFDVVVTLCDKVREVCPEFSTRAQAIHWSIEDPSRLEGRPRAIQRAFRVLLADLEARIGFLIATIDHNPHTSATADTPQEIVHHARS